MEPLKAWEIDFTAPRAREGARLLGFGRISEARALWQKAVEEAPDSPGARYNLAIVHQAAGKFELARAGHQEALRLNPGYERAARELASLDAQLGLGGDKSGESA